jgi:hypothetical protein
MKQGDRVIIFGARGTVHARVEAIRKPEELPDLPELSAGPAREVLEEIGVSRVAMLSYPRPRCDLPAWALTQDQRDQRLIFAALECSGKWYDLAGQELAIEPIGAKETLK